MSWKKYVAELLGTFVLVLVGTGVAVLSGGNMLSTSLAFGLAIVMMAYGVGGISGGHFNPAVSLAMIIKKKLSGRDFALYAVSQVIGAFIGTLFLFFLLDNASSLGQNAVNATVLGTDGLALFKGLLVEIVLTFVFVTTIIGVTSNKKTGPLAGLAIGLTLVGILLVGFNLTGLSVNPARSLAPAVFAGGVALEQIWIFIVGPLVGATLAAFLSLYFDQESKEKMSKESSSESMKEM